MTTSLTPPMAAQRRIAQAAERTAKATRPADLVAGLTAGLLIAVNNAVDDERSVTLAFKDQDGERYAIPTSEVTPSQYTPVFVLEPATDDDWDYEDGSMIPGDNFETYHRTVVANAMKAEVMKQAGLVKRSPYEVGRIIQEALKESTSIDPNSGSIEGVFVRFTRKIGTTMISVADLCETLGQISDRNVPEIQSQGHSW